MTRNLYSITGNINDFDTALVPANLFKRMEAVLTAPQGLVRFNLTPDDAKLVATLVGARIHALQARLDRDPGEDGPELAHMREYLSRLTTLQRTLDEQLTDKCL